MGEFGIQTISLSFFRFSSTRARIWALGMMGGARLSMARVPDLGFWKLCGSGTEEGFTPVPNWGVYAILCTWPDESTARRRLEDTPIFGRYRARATEHWTVFLSATAARGAWSGKTPFQIDGANPTSRETGPVAALTRATINPRIALQFWRQVPGISKVIGADPNVVFKIGIGEVPLLHQITFSIWPDTRSMALFARESGPHARAISAVRSGKWFREELYARFRILGDTGTWDGVRPLNRLPAAA